MTCFRRSVQLRGRALVEKGSQLVSCCQAAKMLMTGTTSCYRSLTEEISAQVFSKERRRLQAQHLWMVVKLRWGVLVDRMYVPAPTGKSKEELYNLLFDRDIRRNRTDPYEEKKYRGAGIKEVQAWWKKCHDWMEHFKEQSLPFVYDFKKLLKAIRQGSSSTVGS